METCRGQDCLVSLDVRETVWICGVVKLEVVIGRISIMGMSITPEDGVRTVYSPKSSALLDISNEIEGTSKVMLRPFEVPIANPLRDLFALQEEAESTMETAFAWLIRDAKCCPSDLVPFSLPPLWREIGDSLLQAKSPLVLVAGPRKVGKSTFCRYLTHRLLEKWPRLAFLDLDPGQTEFTPPSSMTLAVIQSKDAPMGPPLTNQSKLIPLAHTLFLGSSSPSECPLTYVKSLEKLALALEQHKLVHGDKPVIVNTMGWITGLGLCFLQECLQLWRPTHFVAFDQQNAPLDWLQSALYQPSGFHRSGRYNQSPAYHGSEDEKLPQVVQLTPAGSESLRHTARDQRQYALWSYFLAELGSDLNLSIWHHDLVARKPLIIGWSKIWLKTTLGPIGNVEVLRKSLPLAIVGLVNSAEHSESGHCHGMALIRTVDWDRHQYHILTPLPLNYLISHRIDCFLVGNQYLPNTMLQHVI